MGALEDTREAVRQLRRDARLTLFCVLMFAMGTGSTATVFAVYDALVLRPLPVSHPESLVQISMQEPNAPPGGLFEWHSFEALERGTTTLAPVAASYQTNAAYRDGGSARRIRLELVSPSFFSLFEARPVLGRMLIDGDNESNAGELVAVLSYSFWRRNYAADPAIFGRTVLIQNQPFILVGVAAPNFHGATVETTADAWVPARATQALRMEHTIWDLFARVRSGASSEVARQETRAILLPQIQRIFENFPGGPAAFQALERRSRFVLLPIPQGISRLRTLFTKPLRFLLAASAVLFLMTTASVAGLLLARFAARSQELATRLSLGASPARLFRVAASQTVLLALGGSLAGLALTRVGTILVPALLPPVRLLDATTMPLELDLRLDWRLIVFLLLGAAIAALLAAAAPAWKAARTDPGRLLRTVRATGSAHGRALLVAFEIGLCTTLLIAAAQLTLTLWNLRHVDPGFRTNIVSFSAGESALSISGNEQVRRLMETWKEQVRALPGVRDAALSSRPLLHGTGFKATISVDNAPVPPSENLNTSTHAVTAEYFDTLGIPILDGRTFRPEELAPFPPAPTADRPVLVNEAFVRHFFRGRPAVGKHVYPNPPFLILGVVGDAKYRSLREPVPPTIYVPLRLGYPSVVLHVRTETDPSVIIPPVRQLLQKIAPDVPLYEVATMRQDIDSSLVNERLLSGLAGGFSVLAAFIVAAGLFGLLSFLVTQRTREIGIRVAIGAHRVDIFTLISRQTLALTAVGIILGIAGSFAAVRVLQSLLYGVQPADLRTLAAACLAMLATSVAATAFPVWRALRILPAVALREDG